MGLQVVMELGKILMDLTGELIHTNLELEEEGREDEEGVGEEWEDEEWEGEEWEDEEWEGEEWEDEE